MPSHKNSPVKVMFRIWPATREVIALFPEIPGTTSPNTCESYMHQGQHAPATLDLINATSPATPEEYRALHRELTSLGYSLQVVSRATREMRAKRIASLHLETNNSAKSVESVAHLANNDHPNR